MAAKIKDEHLPARLEARREDIMKVLLASPDLDRFGFRMSLWAGLYTGPVYAEMERRFGITRDENIILFSLSIYGSTSAKVIGDYLGRPKNSISRAVERLLRGGLIRSEVDPTDRRRLVLTVEPAGRNCYRHLSRLWRDREAHLLSSLSATEKVALDTILDKLFAIQDWDGPAADDDSETKISTS